METLTVKVPLQQLHFDHEIWLNELEFYRDELRILDKYLLDLVTRNTGQEVLKGIEHFQNQFIRQKEVLDEISHDIREHEQLVLKTIQSLHPAEVAKGRFEDHGDLREAVETFKRIYADLKGEYLSFVAHWI
jgi:hypothetical protein